MCTKIDEEPIFGTIPALRPVTIYNTPTEDIKVDVILKDEDIWATGILKAINRFYQM